VKFGLNANKGPSDKLSNNLNNIPNVKDQMLKI